MRSAITNGTEAIEQGAIFPLLLFTYCEFHAFWLVNYAKCQQTRWLVNIIGPCWRGLYWWHKLYDLSKRSYPVSLFPFPMTTVLRKYGVVALLSPAWSTPFLTHLRIFCAVLYCTVLCTTLLTYQFWQGWLFTNTFYWPFLSLSGNTSWLTMILCVSISDLDNSWTSLSVSYKDKNSDIQTHTNVVCSW